MINNEKCNRIMAKQIIQEAFIASRNNMLLTV